MLSLSKHEGRLSVGPPEHTPPNAVIGKRGNGFRQVFGVGSDQGGGLFRHGVEMEAPTAQEYQTGQRMTKAHNETAEVLIRGDENAAAIRGQAHHIGIRQARRLLGDITDVKAEITECRDKRRRTALVHQKSRNRHPLTAASSSAR